MTLHSIASFMFGFSIGPMIVLLMVAPFWFGMNLDQGLVKLGAFTFVGLMMVAVFILIGVMLR